MANQSVVSIHEASPEVAVIHMEDRDSRNSFSPALVTGLVETFRAAQSSPSYRAIILTGYDNYFCSGGTRDELMSIHAGKMKFTDLPIFDLALRCEIPVISAMQGHAIGGGFVMGLYSDFTLLGKECVYATNFMKYGFTPGMGATLVVPLRLGSSLGSEMLFSAEAFRGGDLQERGCPLRIVPKKDVLAASVQLAKTLAEKPRLALVTLKQHLSRTVRQQLDETIRQELAMHALTFHQQEVAANITNAFG